MKKIPAVLVLLFWSGLAQAQTFDLSDLLGFAGYNAQKIDAYLGKKSFKRDYNSPKESSSNYNYYQIKKSKEGEIVRKISFQEKESTPTLSYQTSSLKEYNDLKYDIKKAGYTCYNESEAADKPLLFQKGNCAINTSVEVADSTTLYTLLIQKIPLPKVKEVAYAEDLLRFNSHECLVAFFGQQNVEKDIFHYTDTEVNKCSVLFPNTSREVIFIWNDEVNYRKPDFLIVGGHLQTKGTAGYTFETVQNEWQTKQGIYSGMQLQELQKLNGEKINFYSWNTDRPGVLAPTSSGAIDFSRLSLVFNCLNCIEKGIQQTANIISSENAIADDRKIYISSIIILPEKEKGATAALR
ncbi:MAG: hypothetical protein JWP88_1249 [Flaviaesturariibacter sp.]|nr:hypothetical protein [Flaviaesturariibacter sp.]